VLGTNGTIVGKQDHGGSVPLHLNDSGMSTGHVGEPLSGDAQPPFHAKFPVEFNDLRSLGLPDSRLRAIKQRRRQGAEVTLAPRDCAIVPGTRFSELA
jgi:hypothetical protein